MGIKTTIHLLLITTSANRSLLDRADGIQEVINHKNNRMDKNLYYELINIFNSRTIKLWNDKIYQGKNEVFKGIVNKIYNSVLISKLKRLHVRALVQVTPSYRSAPYLKHKYLLQMKLFRLRAFINILLFCLVPPFLKFSTSPVRNSRS